MQFADTSSEGQQRSKRTFKGTFCTANQKRPAVEIYHLMAF